MDSKENNLIQQCQNGDFSSFKDLMQRYQARIFSVCYGVLHNREDAYDALQEVLLTLFKSIDKFKYESGLYVWIYRIAVNKSLDIIRKRKRKSKLESKFLDNFGNNVASDNPQKEALHLELKEEVMKAIEALPPKLRLVITLREIELLSYQEIAKIMQCSIGTVMSRLFYARKKLALKLSKYIKN